MLKIILWFFCSIIYLQDCSWVTCSLCSMWRPFSSPCTLLYDSHDCRCSSNQNFSARTPGYLRQTRFLPVWSHVEAVCSLFLCRYERKASFEVRKKVAEQCKGPVIASCAVVRMVCWTLIQDPKDSGKAILPTKPSAAAPLAASPKAGQLSPKSRLLSLEPF